jgi:hypothetical protein
VYDAKGLDADCTVRLVGLTATGTRAVDQDPAVWTAFDVRDHGAGRSLGGGRAGSQPSSRLDSSRQYG